MPTPSHRLLWTFSLLFAACGSPEAVRDDPPRDVTREVTPDADRTGDGAPVLVVGDIEGFFPVGAGEPAGIEGFFPAEPIPIENASGPIDYLDKSAGGEFAELPEDGIRDWIRVEHVPELMKRLDSTRPVAHAVATKSSILPMEQTTEGVLAMYFLHCLSVGQFPAGLGSHMDSFWSEPEAWREWWQRVQRIEKLALPAAQGESPWKDLTGCGLIDRARSFAGSAVLVPSLPPYKWISDDQVPALMARIRSKKPMATLIFPGYVPRDLPAPSTEGETAMMLLHLYAETLRNHHARLTTTRDSKFSRDADSWDQWFKNRRESRR